MQGIAGMPFEVPQERLSCGTVPCEFDEGADHVIGDVLTADEVVSLAMIEGVALENAPVFRPKPFPAVEPVVRRNRAHIVLEVEGTRRP
jgi:hypothetical protein